MMFYDIVLALLLFFNLMVLLIVLLIGAKYMEIINQAITNLQNQLTALQARLGSGVLVQQADLTAAADAINQAATTLSTIGN